VKKLNMDLNGHGVVLRVNPDIARALKEEESGVLRDLQQTLGRPITLRPDAHLHHEQFDVMAIGEGPEGPGGPERPGRLQSLRSLGSLQVTRVAQVAEVAE